MAFFTSLNCPQCAAPLPRQARWRMVTCPYCGAVVTKNEDVVLAAWFHEAHARAHALPASAGRTLQLHGPRYRVLAPLGTGAHCDVLLAERLGPLGQRVTVKLARGPDGAARLEQEAAVLRQLQASTQTGAAYYTQRLPQPVASGMADDSTGATRAALVLCHPPGFWGSLADVLPHYPQGIDPRHAVWMWRRVLEVLGFVHSAGWAHGCVAPEHMLVHPRDHGVLLIGWAGARHGPVAGMAGAMARDLQQSAWAMRVMLHGRLEDAPPTISAQVPVPLAQVLRRASEDATWCAQLGAAGLDQALVQAAREAFGAPAFLPFNPNPHAQPH